MTGRSLRSILTRIHAFRASLGRDRRGLSTIEFAMLAVPLFMIMFAILEVGLALSMNIALANATASVGRQFRVGTKVAPGKAVTTNSGAQISLADFKTAVCQKIFLIGPTTCANNIQIDVRNLASFQTSAPSSPITGSSFDNSSFCYYSGVSGSIVEMRTYYMWPLINPMLWSTLQSITSTTFGGTTTAGHWMAIRTTEVFVIEPNGGVANTGAGC